MTVIINGTTGINLVQDGVVSPVKTQVGALPSMVRLNTANGYGSTNNKIRRFTDVVTNQGTDITYADSATLGASFTINTAGVYAIAYTDNFATGPNNVGVSINSNNLSVGISAVVPSERLFITDTAQAGATATGSITVFLSAGTVLRPQVGAIAYASATASLCHFTITRVA